MNQAEDVFKRTAAEIDDPELREAILNNVPVNCSLRTALQAGWVMPFCE